MKTRRRSPSSSSSSLSNKKTAKRLAKSPQAKRPVYPTLTVSFASIEVKHNGWPGGDAGAGGAGSHGPPAGGCCGREAGSWKKRFRRRRPGETEMPDIADILSRRSKWCTRGVFPTGAHVLATVGVRRNPDSSAKTRWAPSRVTFCLPAASLPERTSRCSSHPFPELACWASGGSSPGCASAARRDPDGIEHETVSW